MLVTVTEASSHLRSETCASRRECLLAHGVAQGKRLHAHERQVPNWRPNSAQEAELFGNTRMRLCHRGQQQMQYVTWPRSLVATSQETRSHGHGGLLQPSRSPFCDAWHL